jgi:hypothetical protein
MQEQKEKKVPTPIHPTRLIIPTEGLIKHFLVYL